MTIEKALENLRFLSTAGAPKLRLEEIESIKLGIEALKWVKRYRPDNKVDRWALLPGEAEEL